ncbi:MAG: TetR/AcrR family transcriptional regulator [Planctomycetes bacterium]|nr:TetR/AcrR family transcriptional regulator [Planctomycetota bacterium]MCA8935114.1 TetR/AcrR family transcriptional regulator [Planctomycetota bacterium]MCA8947093.1 TetR/AcrR family transcriptional regulator [Planctomycetota bacterium]
MSIAQTTDENTHSAILREAATLFAVRGYDAVSVREIVHAAGVTKPSLYYHFGSKAGVAQALIDEFLAAATATRHAVFESTTEVRELLESYTREMLALALQYRNTLAFAFSIWFGRSSLKDLIRQTEEYDHCVMLEWQALLESRGLGQRAAEVTIKAYWALLMQELMKVVQCPDFTGCANSLADEMATLVLHGAKAFDEGKER